MPSANLGRVGFVNKGTWADGLHKVNDLVTYGTAKYACILQHTSVLGNIVPTNTTYWEKWTDYGSHSVVDISNSVTASSDSQYVNYFTGTNTGVLSIKIAGLVTDTASSTDLGFMEITITQDDRDHSSATNPALYKIMVKGNMDAGVWYNTQAQMLGSSTTTPVMIRFTRNTTDAFIEIGETTSTWYYPTVEVAHVASYIIAGYTPIFFATIQESLLGTTTDSIISTSKKIENTIQPPIASASTCTIGTFALGDTVHITGTTTITSLGVSTTGTRRIVVFDGELTLTYNATSLILPNAANITTSSKDTAEFVCENGSSGYWRCTYYQRYSSAYATLNSPAFTGAPTAPTATAGTNTTQVATTAFAMGAGVGSNQTWTNVTAHRGNGAIYTNTTGKPIGVIITYSGDCRTGSNAQVSVNGVQVSSVYFAGGVAALFYAPVSFIVPNGATYISAGGAPFNQWVELR